ncbi:MULTISPECIES: hypothetical protein [unclassified Acinetobacter]|uniref:hypothetical protein n=1 Tax=unclassified Acinetobacter TaxID=196816 RepID=UPI00190991F1|nr:MULTISPECIES: hypothetical protein [unclassified Acinetobacter]MBK0063946.1 hypothetical protein [Acinetobacter sp. S55]MBK0067231.1 hypothetical protein [Acinetobacter sp. S54]
MNINLSFWIPIIVAISALWVYVDASSHKIGKTPQKGFFNIGAGWWGVACLFFWIIAFPCYLYKRNDLIELAKVHPVEPKARGIKIGFFAFICLLRIIFLF